MPLLTRTPSLRRRLLVALAALPASAGALVLPVATPPASAARPVPPTVVQVPLTGIDPAAARAAGSRVPQPERQLQADRAPARLAVLTAQRGTSPFRLVGVTWEGAPPAGLAIEARTRVAGAWGGWTALEPSADVPDADTDEGRRVLARRHTEPLLAPGSDGVQVRVATATGRPPVGLRLELVDPGTSPADARMTGTTPASSASAAATTPTIITRAQWGADESLRTGSPRYTSGPKVGFIHHTASSNSYWQNGGGTLADAARDIRAIYAYSVRSGGYADMPYNFLVDMSGRIYEGRAGGMARPVLSGATGGFNTGSFAVAALGNLATAAPSSALVDGLARIMAWRLDVAHLDPTGSATLVSSGGSYTAYPAGRSVTFRVISGHRDASITACPGEQLYAQLAAIRGKAKALMGAALFTPSLAPRTATPGTPVTVAAAVPGPQSWTLTVTDLCTGGTVRTVSGSVPAAGPLRAVWDGRTTSGAVAPLGRFQLTLTSRSTTATGGPGTARPVTLTHDALSAAGSPLACPAVARVAGADRYATAVALGRVAAPAATTAVLVNGADASVIDGLVAGPLAAARKAPLLLATATGVPAVTGADLRARGVRTVLLVGGSGVLGSGVASALRGMGVTTITRLAGADRYATAAAVAQAVAATSAAVLVTSGQAAGTWDTVVAGGVGAAVRRPVLLTQADRVPEATRQALQALGTTATTVVGSSSVVSDAVMAGLPRAYRVTGSSPAATSVAAVRTFERAIAPRAVTVARGEGPTPADALAAGSLGRPVLLTSATVLPTSVADWLTASSVRSATVVGGTGVVSDPVLLAVSRSLP